MKFLLKLFLLIFITTAIAQTNDPFLQSRYDNLHDSPAQQRFRQLAPMPAGIVYVQQPGEGGYEPFTNELLKKLNILLNTLVAELLQHPAMLKHQRKCCGSGFCARRHSSRAVRTNSSYASAPSRLTRKSADADWS
jgi:hypothetical protein